MEWDPVGQAGTQQGRTEPCRTAREGAALTLRSSTSPRLRQPQPHSSGVQTSVSPRHPCHQSLQPQPHRRLHGRAPPAPAAPWKRPHAAAPSHPQAAPHPRAVRSLTLGPPPPARSALITPRRRRRAGGCAPRPPRHRHAKQDGQGLRPPSAPEGTAAFQGRSESCEANRVLQESGEGSEGGGGGMKRTPPAQRGGWH